MILAISASLAINTLLLKNTEHEWEPANTTLQASYAGSLAHFPAAAPGNVVHFLSFEDADRTLLVGTHNGEVQFWNINRKSLIRKFKLGREGRGYALGPKKTLYTLQSDGKVALRNLSDGKVRRFLDLEHPASSLVGSSNLKHIAITDQTGVRVLPTVQGRSIMVPGGKNPRFASCAGAIAVVEPSATIGIYDLKTCKLKKRVPLAAETRQLLDISAGAEYVAIRKGYEGDVSILHVRTGRESQSLKDSLWTDSAQFSADGTKIVLGLTPGQVRVFSSTTGNRLASFRGAETGSSYPVRNVAFSSKGYRIAAAYWEGTVVVYDLRH